MKRNKNNLLGAGFLDIEFKKRYLNNFIRTTDECVKKAIDVWIWLWKIRAFEDAFFFPEGAREDQTITG